MSFNRGVVVVDLVAFQSSAPCASRPGGDERQLHGSRTGFLDRVSQPRSSADAHPAATVWDRRQVRLDMGWGQTLLRSG